ncbi:uncharacterized protein TM35_000051880 [Trypanosoma theileri]|uniref:EF-hand domain-containing protein n=1 Tax=Trypanosoma theileri TaxID=67003 RepID=A0A1X0P3U1_9TRYP|nr:uncharacterized protein TM35_000051880 [Trypanosoma theileri]ORC91592.1 hypothetical protein TM35_000051880 [Trypanosoma theileri]
MVTTSECHASAVIGVPPYVVSSLFKDITGIKEYGRDGLISCCLLETSIPPTEVGAVRRVTLALPDYDGAILRESLSEVRDAVGRTYVCMEYVPCTYEDAYRSPFGVDGTAQLMRASMQIAVSEVTSHSKRCFLEITTAYTVNVDEGNFVIRRDGGMSRDPVYGAIAAFWDVYTHRLVSAVEQYVLSLAAVVHTHTRMEVEEAKEYTEVEDTYCAWAAMNGGGTSGTLPRADVLQTMAKALNAWLRLWRDLRHQRRVNAQLQEDADGSKAIVSAAAANAAENAAVIAAATITSADGTDQGSFRTASDISSFQSLTPKPYRRTTAAATLSGQSAHSNGEGSAVQEMTNGNIASSKETGMQKVEHVPFFSSGGGRCLTASTEDNSGKEHQKGQTKEDQKTDAPPFRLAAPEFHSDLLQNFLTEFGTINEKNARELFSVLDTNQQGFINEKGIGFVLSQIDPLGLYEDRDGTLLQMAECRRAVGAGVFKDNKSLRRNYNNDVLGPTTNITTTATTSISTTTTNTNMKEEDKLLGQEGSEGKDNNNNNNNNNADAQLTPLQALIRRHDAQKKAMYDELMKKRTEKMLDSFAYKTRGKLYYDEFCLMMLHLLKEY